MQSEKIEYYKINETLEHKYYQIPQELFTNPYYKDNLSLESKVLYAFLLDRLTLSIKNNWYDEENNIYLIFTREEVQNKLNLSSKTVIKAFKQLTEIKLVKEKRQGLGKPNLIFVGKIVHQNIEDFFEQENKHLQKCKNYTSRDVKNTVQEVENVQAINTYNINTNKEDDIALKDIKAKCKLEEFEKEDKYILEDVIDRLYNSTFLKIRTTKVENSKILDKLKLIKKDNLIQLLNIRKDSCNIKNIVNYLMICLYNNLGNTNINKSANSKKSNNRYVGRNYSEDFLESLYDNITFA